MPLAEKSLIAGIRRLAKSRQRGSRILAAGIGDDCAILRQPSGRETLVTTDFTLEGIHFRREWHPPEAVGHRCLARGLSDIASMGGKPAAAFLSLALPRKLAQGWVNRFLRGMLTLADRYDVVLAGGDTAESPDGVLADIIVIGTVPKGKAVLRSGARPGHRIYVSGELGGSAGALVEMLARKKKVTAQGYPRHFYPEPRMELGRILRERGLASAMIDSSDGLSTDLAHICEESGVGAEIEAAAIPRARLGRPAHEVDQDLALHGGEDYELLFTAPRGKPMPSRLAGIPVTEIGHITRGPKILIFDGQVGHELEARGWEHFR